MAGPRKNIQKRGAPVRRARPWTRHRAYNTTYRECARQNQGYALLRINGCANTNIIHMIMNSNTPVVPIIRNSIIFIADLVKTDKIVDRSNHIR